MPKPLVQDGSFSGVFGQRYDAGGTAQATEFRVNTPTGGSQSSPAVAADAGGNFVVTWSGYGSGDYAGIFARRFSSAGLPLGVEFRVNSYTTGIQASPVVASASDGSFVVAWESPNQDGSSFGVFGQRFDSAGAALGGEFQVNAYMTGNQRTPAIASDSAGDFVVVWHSYGQDGSQYGIFGRRFSSAGSPVGSEFSAWTTSATDGGDLSVSGAAALASTAFGLQAFVNDTNSLFVQDSTPNSESRYRARFYFDTNGFDPGEAQSHFRTRIFTAFDPAGLRVITLVLKRQVGAYSLEARVRRDDGTRVDTGFFPISDGPHFIELDWQRATGPGAVNGSLEMWIDNTPVATLSGIDNDLRPVDFARLGALAVKTGAAGTLYYDQFESRRQVFIGPK